MAWGKKLLFLLSLAAVLCASFFANAEDVPVYRALLIGCDQFLTEASTSPAAARNIDLLARALKTDERGYARIQQESDSVASLEGFEKAVESAFEGASGKDVSLIYISTHGLYQPGQPLDRCALLFSDGNQETALTAADMKRVLDQVPGIKVLILDACRSGAFIGKGLANPSAGMGVFCDPDYRLLCSSGGSEDSWYWHSEDDGDPSIQYGASYFATVLARILTPGLSPADLNRDGTVTLTEANLCLRTEYAASTPHVYPENADDFILYQYSVTGIAPEDTVIRSLQLENNVITSADPVLRFTFTQTGEADVYYQIITRQNGVWDFSGAQMIADRETAADAGKPGMKQRELTLMGLDWESYGYVMLLVITKPQGHAELQASALISVQSETGLNPITVIGDGAFDPRLGQEASILVLHEKPCSVTAAILDADGRTIRWLCFSEPSRPLGFSGTTLYWDGKKTDGTYAEPGTYSIRITAYSGSFANTVLSSGPELLP